MKSAVEGETVIVLLGWQRSFCVFFKIVFPFFSSARAQLVFNSVCYVAIDDLSPTHSYRKDSALVGVQQRLAKELSEVNGRVHS